MSRHVFIKSATLFASSSIVTLCCSLLLFSAPLQPVNAQGFTLGKQGKTRAIVIGISEYANDEIEDLQFADRDAKAFYDFITSPAGGSVQPEDIKLLTNDQATNAKINEVMDWLMENSNDGDRAIIYFSGHGDVETVSKRKQGFLLTHDSPSKVYRAGAYPIYYLQITLETLAASNVETIVITDACRSGKLAGNDFGGTQATALALQQQFANEVKIMSCQPDEFSLEGTQWGGGRSVFSYYLIQGLMGIADKDQDGIVTLLEIGRYLEDQVTRSVAPKQQIPLVEGDRNSAIALVDEETLKSLIEEISPALASQGDRINKTGNAQGEGSNTEALSQEAGALLSAFNTSLKKGDLFGGEQSAYTIYQQIAKNEEFNEIRYNLSRQLSTALQEECQKAINLYLESDARELNDRWNFSEKYSKYPIYLEKAAELLPADHYSLNWLKCNQLYFEGVLLRLDWEKTKSNKSDLLKARNLQLQALSFDEYASHVFNELGLIYSDLGDRAKEIESYLKALELSPNWAMPNSNLAVAYMQTGDMDKAIPLLEKAIREKPEQSVFYLNLAFIYKSKDDLTTAISHIEKAIELDGENWQYYIQLSEFQIANGDLNDAKNTLSKAEILCTSNPVCLNMLAYEFYTLKDYAGYYRLLNLAISLSPDNDLYQNNLIYYYLAVEEYNEFEALALDLIANSKVNSYTAYELASYYARNNMNDKAIEYLELAFNKGFEDIDHLLTDEDFESIKESKRFNELVNKYKK